MIRNPDSLAGGNRIGVLETPTMKQSRCKTDMLTDDEKKQLQAIRALVRREK